MEKKQELGLGKLPPSKVSLRKVVAQKAPGMSPSGQECTTPLLSTPCFTPPLTPRYVQEDRSEREKGCLFCFCFFFFLDEEPSRQGMGKSNTD